MVQDFFLSTKDVLPQASQQDMLRKITIESLVLRLMLHQSKLRTHTDLSPKSTIRMLHSPLERATMNQMLKSSETLLKPTKFSALKNPELHLTLPGNRTHIFTNLLWVMSNMTWIIEETWETWEEWLEDLLRLEDHMLSKELLSLELKEKSIMLMI